MLTQDYSRNRTTTNALMRPSSEASAAIAAFASLASRDRLYGGILFRGARDFSKVSIFRAEVASSKFLISATRQRVAHSYRRSTGIQGLSVRQYWLPICQKPWKCEKLSCCFVQVQQRQQCGGVASNLFLQ
jgi:hypothetical protein